MGRAHTSRILSGFSVRALLAFFLVFSTAIAQTESPSDQLIAVAVENELLQSDEVPADSITVDVTRGVVTLSGRVDTLSAEERAIQRASRVKGVTAIVNQINVWPSPRKDEEIARDVQAALKSNPATGGIQVSAKVQGGDLHLTGAAQSYAEKQLAELEAKRVRGVLKVANDIKVRASPRADQEILPDIQQLIAASAELDDADITATVKDGIAVLNGTVGTAYQKELASAKALLAGAREVDARGIKVDWDRHDGTLRHRRYQDLDATKINESLKLALHLDPRLVGQSVQVNVQKGVATLTGEVNRLESKEAAGEIAAHTTGVISVRNRLQVRPADPPPSDEEISRLVREALRRDAVVGHQDIIVRTRNAHVHLYGLVDTKFEKQRAHWTARGQRGVVHVANQLSVPTEWTPKSDDAIKEDLEQKIAWTLCCRGQTIDVTVEDGVAILRGQVATWLEWQAAMDLALEAGARRPHNLLKVLYRPSPGAPHAYVPQ